MSPLLCMAMLMLPGATADVVVHPGEGWEALAARVLGDPRAAGELRALNPGGPDVPAAGTRLTLPGPDRALAVHALSSARSALDQAAPGASARAPAQEKLEKAEHLLQSAQYAAAAQEADSAWRLLSQAPTDATRFAVEVNDDGKTHVGVQHGSSVRVEAEGKVQRVAAGQGLDVVRGSAPTPPGSDVTPELPSPELLRPADNSRLNVPTNAEGLAQVRVAWRAVAGARAYAVELVSLRARGARPRTLRVPSTEASLPPLPAGTYRWRVRALGEGDALGVTAERTFQLMPSPLKLEVKESTWK